MRIVLTVLVVMIGWSQMQAQGIDFFKGNWEEALAEAKKQEKVIFVDAYAEWCGPCKRMDKLVFSDREVGEFYNKNFINVKMDMEHGEGPEFGRTYPVAAFPTFFFIDYSGEVVLKVRGAQMVDAFLGLGKSALRKVDRTDIYAKEYEKGNRDPKLVYNYIKALNNTGESTLKIANDYLNNQDDLTTDLNLKIIMESTTEADSRIFNLLIEHRDAIAELTSEEDVLARIEQACQATVRKAMDFEVEMLLTEAQEKMAAHHPEKAEEFTLQSEMLFATATEDVDRYLDACKDFAKMHEEDAALLFDIVENIKTHFSDDSKAMKFAEKLSKQASKI